MEEEKDFERVEAPSAVPYFAVGVFCLLYSLIFPLYRLWHFLIPAVSALAVYFIFKKLCKPRYITVEVPKAPKTEDEKWNGMAAEYLKKLRDADDAIGDEEISQSIRKIEELSSVIFECVAQQKENRLQVRRFTEYYLPTVLKLLSVYDKMEDGYIDGKNIRETKEKIRNLLYTAEVAFAKLADDLYEQDSIDVSSDIAVFNNLLNMEGLVDGNE